MFSILKPTYVYRDISEDIADHDDDFDAEEWNYNGRDVFRGAIDPNYPDWNVYWLYDDSLKRVGLAEHDPDTPEIFHSLWFYDSPFATLFQEPGWIKKDVTLWSLLSSEAYQDCLEHDFKTVFDMALSSSIRLVTSDMVLNKPQIYQCDTCNKKSLQPLDGCQEVKVLGYFVSDFSILFLDDSFILYTAPIHSRVWSMLNLTPPHDDQSALEQQALPSELADQLALEEPLTHPDSESSPDHQPASPPE